MAIPQLLWQDCLLLRRPQGSAAQVPRAAGEEHDASEGFLAARVAASAPCEVASATTETQQQAAAASSLPLAGRRAAGSHGCLSPPDVPLLGPAGKSPEARPLASLPAGPAVGTGKGGLGLHPPELGHGPALGFTAGAAVERLTALIRNEAARPEGRPNAPRNAGRCLPSAASPAKPGEEQRQDPGA